MQKVMRRVGAPKRENRDQPAYAPLLKTVEDFARLHAMSLSEDLTIRRWAEAQCILKWTSTRGHTCVAYLSGGPGDFHVDVLCWSGERLTCSRRWSCRAFDAQHALRSILKDAYHWAEGVL